MYFSMPCWKCGKPLRASDENLGHKAGRIVARNDRMAQSSGKQAMLLKELAQPFFARFGDECAPRKVACRASYRARVRLADRQEAAVLRSNDDRHAQVPVPVLDALQCLGVSGTIHFLIRHLPFGQQLPGASLIRAIGRASIEDKMNWYTMSAPIDCQLKQRFARAK